MAEEDQGDLPSSFTEEAKEGRKFQSVLLLHYRSFGGTVSVAVWRRSGLIDRTAAAAAHDLQIFRRRPEQRFAASS